MPFTAETADWAKGHLDALHKTIAIIKDMFEKRGEPKVVKDLERAQFSVNSARAHLEGR